MVKAIGEAQKRDKSAGAFLVLLEKDSEANRRKLDKLALDAGVTFPLTINSMGTASPPGYNLGSDAKTTIVLYKEKKVVETFAFRSALGDEDLKKVVEAIQKNKA